MSLPQNYDDPHRYRSEVHYRLYEGRSGPTVICVQDFDYLDYDATKFLSSEAWDNELEAEYALIRLVNPIQQRALAVQDIKAGQIVDVVLDPRTGVSRVFLTQS